MSYIIRHLIYITYSHIQFNNGEGLSTKDMYCYNHRRKYSDSAFSLNVRDALNVLNSAGTCLIRLN